MEATAAQLRSELLNGVAKLLDYPDEHFASSARTLALELALQCNSDIARALGEFANELKSLGDDELEEIHTRTFSLAPICVPYVGVQMFGENNFKRGDLIAGFARELKEHGIEYAPELPDHLAAVLQLAGHLDGEPLQELLNYCLAPAVAKMCEQIETSSSPYRHLLRAIHLCVAQSLTERCCHA